MNILARLNLASCSVKASSLRKQLHALPMQTRTFLICFVPMCLALLTSALFVGSAIHKKLTENLASSLYRTESVLQHEKGIQRDQVARLMQVITDSIELKASLGLF